LRLISHRIYRNIYKKYSGVSRSPKNWGGVKNFLKNVENFLKNVENFLKNFENFLKIFWKILKILKKLGG
jgi:hypothetical protein